MKIISSQQIDNLIEIEWHIHYKESPPKDVLPFVILDRGSPFLLSAPHGCRTYRNRNGETWHEEDEYTTGMALLLGELCRVSVIATIWQTKDSDPNDTIEKDNRVNRLSPYKMAVRRLCEQGAHWVIDLHGARQDTKNMDQDHLVDLGTRKELKSLPDAQLNKLQEFLEASLGSGVVHRNGFPAREDGRTITSFCHGDLNLHAVQIEMKPSVRVAHRRVDATMYGKPISEGGGPYDAPASLVLGMMQSLVDFIEYLKVTKE